MAARYDTVSLRHDTIALQMASRMEVLAANGDWVNVGQQLVRLQQALLDIPESERREALLETARSLERVQTLALAKRRDVTDKLSEIRRGKVATRAYTGSSGSAGVTALR